MTKITMSVVDAQNAAHALGVTLGSVRSWSDFLTDCIKGKTHYFGLTLMPVCYVKNCSQRPVYLRSEIDDFLKNAVRASPPPADPLALRPFSIEIDAAALDLPVKLRRGKRLPEPVAPASSSTATLRRPIMGITPHRHALDHHPRRNPDRQARRHPGRCPTPRIHRSRSDALPFRPVQRGQAVHVHAEHRGRDRLQAADTLTRGARRVLWT